MASAAVEAPSPAEPLGAAEAPRAAEAVGGAAALGAAEAVGGAEASDSVEASDSAEEAGGAEAPDGGEASASGAWEDRDIGGWMRSGVLPPADEKLLASLTVTCEEAQELFFSVAQRAENLRATKRWLEARRHRLTSSRFGRASEPHMRKRVLDEMVAQPEGLQGAELTFGIQNEHRAREAYKRLKPSYLVKEVGVLVSPKLPFLAASPDGLVYTETEERGLLEIKTQQHGLLPDVAEMVHKRPETKYQIMGALRLVRDVLDTAVRWCDLFLWSPRDEPQCLRIFWDQAVWEGMYTKLHLFYFSHYLPLWRKMARGNSDADSGQWRWSKPQPRKKKKRRK